MKAILLLLVCSLFLLTFSEKSCKLVSFSGTNKPGLRCSGFQHIPNAEERKINPTGKSLPWADEANITVSSSESCSSLLLDEGNIIQKLEDYAISKAKFPPTLNYLQLGNCSIKEISPEAFFGGENIFRLNLSHNRLEYLNPKVFKYLIRLGNLHLNENPIKYFHEGSVFPALPNLMKLELKSCELIKIEPELFKNLHAITELNLGMNSLTTLTWKILPPLQKLNFILLNDNPWRCDCDLRLFLNNLDNQIPQTFKVFYDILNCNSSSSELLSTSTSPVGKTWKGFRSLQLHCPPEALTVNQNNSQAQNLLKPGDNIPLVCNYFGIPEPNVTWLKDGIALRNSSKTKMKQIKQKENGSGNNYIFGQLLKIQSLTWADGGSYACYVTNSSISMKLNLDHLDRPTTSTTETKPEETTEMFVESTTEKELHQDHSTEDEENVTDLPVNNDELQKEEGHQGWLIIVLSCFAFLFFVGFCGGICIWKGRQRDRQEEEIDQMSKVRYATTSYMRRKLKGEPVVQQNPLVEKGYIRETEHIQVKSFLSDITEEGSEFGDFERLEEVSLH